MLKRILTVLLTVLALAMSAVPPAGAAGMSLNEAVQQAQRQTGGRVLSADTVSQGGRTVHRVKVLTPAGQVRVLVFDAQGGGR